MKNRTTIVIAHRPATIALADRVVLLDDGHIIVEGTHDQLLETSEEYRQVLARQLEGDGLEGLADKAKVDADADAEVNA
jgi:ATP-binding cassette subfamily B protein